MSEASNPATAVVLKVIEVLEHTESLPVLLHERYKPLDSAVPVS